MLARLKVDDGPGHLAKMMKALPSDDAPASSDGNQQESNSRPQSPTEDKDSEAVALMKERGDFRLHKSACRPTSEGDSYFCVRTQLTPLEGSVDGASRTSRVVAAVDIHVFVNRDASRIVQHWSEGNALLRSCLQEPDDSVDSQRAAATRPRSRSKAESKEAQLDPGLQSPPVVIPHVWKTSNFRLRSGVDGAYIMYDSPQQVLRLSKFRTSTL